MKIEEITEIEMGYFRKLEEAIQMHRILYNMDDKAPNLYNHIQAFKSMKKSKLGKMISGQDSKASFEQVAFESMDQTEDQISKLIGLSELNQQFDLQANNF